MAVSGRLKLGVGTSSKRPSTTSRRTDKAGAAGVAFWVNSRLGLRGNQRLDKRHPGVAATTEWVRDQYADGRSTSLSEDEMLSAAVFAGVVRVSKQKRKAVARTAFLRLFVAFVPLVAFGHVSAASGTPWPFGLRPLGPQAPTALRPHVVEVRWVLTDNGPTTCRSLPAGSSNPA